MGYTLSFVADVKCGLGDVGGLLHHAARDVDRANGCEVTHSNKDIDPARTHLNETLVADGKGGWVRCTDTEQIKRALIDRLAAVKKPLRHDATVLRPFELQLDPEWYKAHKDPAERAKAEQHMRDWAAKTFGAENLIYWTLHLDETNPHLEAGFCPVTSDGRLAQKDWFPSPSDLRKKHDDFRKHMAAAGYDIDMKRRKPGKHAKRMSVDEYKDFARLQEERQQLDAAQERASTEAQQLRKDAEEYARKTKHKADQDAKKTTDQAEKDATAIRTAARQDAEKIVADAAAKATAIQTAIREKIKSEVDDAKKERRAVRAALQGDLETWGGLTSRPNANKLLHVLGAAAEASRTPPTSTGIAAARSQLMEQLMRTAARDEARWKESGPTPWNGPTR